MATPTPAALPVAKDTRVTELYPLTSTKDRPCLVQLRGPEIGKRFELTLVETILGRHIDATIQLDEDNVSRRHCTITDRGPLGVVVRDDGSTNGTFLNNIELQTEQQLSSGDLIRVGSFIFKYLAGGELGSIESQYHEEIYRLAIVDGLTQVHNKRYLLEFLEREMARCGRFGHTMSLAILDVDHFKKLNDTFGHLAGDAVLRDLAALLKTRIRKDECLARYGGEEFALVLPETPRAVAVQLVEQLRRQVEQHAFAFVGQALPVTFSAGVAEITAGDESPLAFIHLADQKLYEAKRGGRNRVVS